MNSKPIVPLLLIGVAGLFAGQAGAVELLTNGNFETGTFTGWTNTAQAGSNSSGFFASTPGAATPSSAFPTAGNAAGGTTYAVSDQTGPGAYALTQSFIVPIGSTSVTLSFDMFVNDQSGSGPVVDPTGLDFTTGGINNSNQHARVDILTGTSTALSTAAADIVANLYLGVDGGVTPNPYTSYNIDITSLVTPGTTYQIRFAEVDNLGQLNQGIDNVSIDASSSVAGVPEPGTLALIGLGLAGIGFARRKKQA